MSYILEALKKSEKKRQGEQHKLTHLATEEVPDQRSNKPRRPLWPLIVGLALVLNAGIMLLVFLPARSPDLIKSTADSTPEHAVATNSLPVKGDTAELAAQSIPPSDSGSDSGTQQPLSASASAPPRSPAAASPPAPPAAENSSVQTAPSAQMPQQKQNLIAGSSEVGAPETTALSSSTAEDTNAKRDTSALTATSEEPEKQASPADAIDEAAPTRFSDMPASYRRQLPEMHMSVHAYAEAPDSGLVRINNKMLRPGAYLDKGLRLEEITREGAIFSYAGQRFLLPRR